MTGVIVEQPVSPVTAATTFSPRRIGEIAAECAVLPDLDKRSPEEILGYGTAGEFADGNR